MMAKHVKYSQPKLGIRWLTDKRCPKCNGCMLFELDPDIDYYLSCLNCGYVEYLRSLVYSGTGIIKERWE